MCSDGVRLPVRYTHHFHDQLFARFGIVLTKSERRKLMVAVANAADANPWVLEEDRVEMHCRWDDGRKFCAIYLPERRLLVTAVTAGRTGGQKFKKKVIPKLHPQKVETREEHAARMKSVKKARIRRGQKTRRWRANMQDGLDLAADE